MSTKDTNIDARLAVLEHEQKSLNMVINSINAATKKISDVTGEIKNLASVQEERLNRQSESINNIFKINEHRRKETMEIINSLKKELKEDIKEIKDDIDESELKTQRLIKELDDKVNRLQKVIYTIIGAATIIEILVRNINIFS